jgi:hypothetical protein
LDERLFLVGTSPWYDDIANYRAANIIPKDYNDQQRKKLLKDATFYVWDDPFLFKRGIDGLLRRCIPQEEQQSILWHCHNSSSGGHYNGEKTTFKVLQSRFYWPFLFKDARHHVKMCDKCKRRGNTMKKNERHLNPIHEVEAFDVWGMDFMEPFPNSFNNS